MGMPNGSDVKSGNGFELFWSLYTTLTGVRQFADDAAGLSRSKIQGYSIFTGRIGLVEELLNTWTLGCRCNQVHPMRNLPQDSHVKPRSSSWISRR